MAVDYYHRVVVTGPAAGVRELRKGLHREYERTVRRRTWTEVIPFSFLALSEIAPGVRRILGSEPFDPYDQSVWPVRRIGDARAELRYQLHTRNLEMRGLVRALSRALPRLTFILITFCLDDGDIESYRFRKGSDRSGACRTVGASFTGPGRARSSSVPARSSRMTRRSGGRKKRCSRTPCATGSGRRARAGRGGASGGIARCFTTSSRSGRSRWQLSGRR